MMQQEVPVAEELAQLQRFMQEALMQQGSLPNAAQVGRYISPSGRLSPQQHLAIYQRGYFARLLQCMRGQFTALNHALGPELFDDFAREYLREVPSRSPTLALLGHDFVAFLQRNRPDGDAEEKEIWVDFMVDLADFEWTLYGLFDAAGAEQDGYATLAQVDDPQLRLQPCVRLCHYRFPVSEYYRQVAREENPEFPLMRAEFLALVRTNYQIGIFPLLPAQHHFLCQLQQIQPGQSIDEMLQKTAREFRQEDAQKVAQAWQAWQRGWLPSGFFRK